MPQNLEYIYRYIHHLQNRHPSLDDAMAGVQQRPCSTGSVGDWQHRSGHYDRHEHHPFLQTPPQRFPSTQGCNCRIITTDCNRFYFVHKIYLQRFIFLLRQNGCSLCTAISVGLIMNHSPPHYFIYITMAVVSGKHAFVIS